VDDRAADLHQESREIKESVSNVQLSEQYVSAPIHQSIHPINQNPDTKLITLADGVLLRKSL
jgi:hypothetical protein